jgi:hypothetical protein
MQCNHDAAAPHAAAARSGSIVCVTLIRTLFRFSFRTLVGDPSGESGPLQFLTEEEYQCLVLELGTLERLRERLTEKGPGLLPKATRRGGGASAGPWCAAGTTRPLGCSWQEIAFLQASKC